LSQQGECVFFVFTKAAHAETDLHVERNLRENESGELRLLPWGEPRLETERKGHPVKNRVVVSPRHNGNIATDRRTSQDGKMDARLISASPAQNATIR